MATPFTRMLTTKLIITNRSALEQKYGEPYQLILDDLKALQARDNEKLLDTRIIFLDDAAQMQSANATPVTVYNDESQCKQAIDQLYRFYTPGYIVILGSQDIVPLQKLKNLLPGDHDPDAFIPSDLPYACDTPYDTDPGKFISPTRVVGRIPDIPAVADVNYLRTLLSNIINARPVAKEEYQSYFSISTYDWQESTRHSLLGIFGNHDKMLISPGDNELTGTNWTTELFPKTHFINCHGAINNPGYYGQKLTDFPLILRSDALADKISPGTVVAAECCYGGQLFDPKKNGAKRMSIANSYLLNKALGFLGSSNIAYGPSTGQGLADLLTQFFLQNVLNGASTGRALLEARQKFLNEMGPTLDPFELKTAAQFNLLGDPSWQPVVNNMDPGVAETREIFINTLQNRRDNLEARGKMLDDFIHVPYPADTEEVDPSVHSAISQILQEKQFTDKTLPKVFINRKKKHHQQAHSVKFHVFSEPADHEGTPIRKVLVVKEKNNQILGYREYVSK